MDQMNLNKINNFSEQDLYGVILYAIYKNTKDPKYATLSELIYTLDKKSLLNFCSIFGGLTIKVPTLNELRLYTNALLLYQKVSNGTSLNDAYKEIDVDRKDREDILGLFYSIQESVNDYCGNNS